MKMHIEYNNGDVEIKFDNEMKKLSEDELASVIEDVILALKNAQLDLMPNNN